MSGTSDREARLRKSEQKKARLLGPSRTIGGWVADWLCARGSNSGDAGSIPVLASFFNLAHHIFSFEDLDLNSAVYKVCSAFR